MGIKPWTAPCGDCGDELTLSVNSGSGLVVAQGPRRDNGKPCCWKTFAADKSRQLKDAIRAANDSEPETQETPTDEPVQDDTGPEPDRGRDPKLEPERRRRILR